MGHVRRFLLRCSTVLRASRAERELAREIQAHLQLLEDRHVALRQEHSARELAGGDQTVEGLGDVRDQLGLRCLGGGGRGAEEARQGEQMD